MATPSICFLLLAVVSTWAAASSSDCDQPPVATFNVNMLVNCGSNGESWSVWNVPGKAPYCGADIIDKTRDGKFVCYDIEDGTCNRIPYVYSRRNALVQPNLLERDLGDGTKSTSLILDTDNCNYLVQLECFPDGSGWNIFGCFEKFNPVSRYVTYKSTWTTAGKEALKTKAATTPALSFVQNYTLDCANGNV